MANENDSKFVILLEHLKRSRGFDFQGYKRTTLVRRVLKRMQTVGISDYLEYLDYLEVHPDEFTQLFNTILINVTSFFRDEPAWDILGKEIIPQLLAQKSNTGLIRVWSAGCASGEEVYSLAMLLSEVMGAETFIQRVKIYATDADEEALAFARQGIYAEKSLKPVPANLREKYFKQNGNEYIFRSDLRRSVVFGRHDLVQDAPISRLDLLVCRNTLMYFNAETQHKILARFHFALNPDGFLFLGKAEMLLTHPNLFSPEEMAARIFTKNLQPNLRDRLLILAQSDSEGTGPLATYDRIHELAFDTDLLPQVILDAAGCLILANKLARSTFNLAATDLGRPLKELELSYRPVELLPAIERVFSDLQTEKLVNVEVAGINDGPRWLDIVIKPLIEKGNQLLGVAVSFENVTVRQTLQADLQNSRHELEVLTEEIGSAHEELETTNEELQSTNEELETTNEELQATNEELETMNEELQATNEELETMNDELSQRTEDSNIANAFLNSILASLQSGVIVVDQKLNLLLWNKRAEDLWGLRADEVKGKSLYLLDIGLPVEKIPLQAFLSGSEKFQEMDLVATNRRGRTIQCHIVCTPFLSIRGETDGIVLLIEEI